MVQSVSKRLVKELVQMGAPHFVHTDGTIYVSAEDTNSYQFVDFYGEYRGGYPWIVENLKAVAKKLGGHWEWQNPGCIVFVEG